MVRDNPEKIADRYEIRDIIGGGGMGTVYLAHDPMLDIDVAIKMLQSVESSEAIIRFQNEAVATGKLGHKNIARTLDFGNVHGRVFMVMEYVEGESLASALKSAKRFPVERALPLFLDICAGLAHAHGNGVLHRDLKPSNVMLTKGEGGQEYAKIVDFGIAKLEGIDQRLTRTGGFVGSPLYVSPEQAQNEVVDARSDIYSLGCLMYETIAGRPPLRGDTAIDTINLKLAQTPASLSAAYAGGNLLPVGLVEAVDTCLKIDPDLRYQNVKALEQKLESVFDELLTKPEDQEPANAVSVGASRKISTVAPTVIVVILLSASVSYCYRWWLSESKKESPKVSDPFSNRPIRGSSTTIDKQNSPRNEDAGTSEQTRSKEQAYDSPAALRMIIEPSESLQSAQVFRPVQGDPGRVSAKLIDDQQLKELQSRKDIYDLQISQASQFNGSGLKYVEDLPLFRLSLVSVPVDDEALKSIGRMHSLQILSLLETHCISDRGLSHLKGLTKLVDLGISSNRISDTGVKILADANFPLLWRLEVSQSDGITDGCIPALKRMKKLTDLNIGNTRITADGAIDLLKSNRKISRLNLQGMHITDRLVDELVSLRPAVLNLRDTDINNAQVIRIAGIKNIIQLELQCEKMDETGFRALSNNSSIQSLMLNGVTLNGKIMQAILPMRVQNLYFRRSKIREFQFIKLAEMGSLQSVKIDQCRASVITPEGIDAFKQSFFEKWHRKCKVMYCEDKKADIVPQR